MGIRITAGKRIFGFVIALLLGLFLPFVAVIQISLLQPLLLLGSVFIVFLQAYAGWIPAVTLTVMELVSTDFFLGTTFAFIILLVNVLPAWLIIFNANKNKSFFNQLKNALIYYGGSLLAAVGIAYILYGSDMISKAVAMLKTEMDSMPDELFQPIVESLNLMLSAVGQTYTVASLKSDILPAVFSYIQQAYVVMLPGILLAGGLLSAVLAVLWINWLRARKGYATSESYISPRNWYLPSSTTVGLIAIWAATYLLTMSGLESGDIACVTMQQITGWTFTIQALAALNRRMENRGVGRSGRIVLTCLAAFLSQLFPIYVIGVCSALFGSHGAIRLWMQKKRDTHNDQ